MVTQGLLVLDNFAHPRGKLDEIAAKIRGLGPQRNNKKNKQQNNAL